LKNFVLLLNLWISHESNQTKEHQMKRFLLLGILWVPMLGLRAQEPPRPTEGTGINRENLVIRPNSRDYSIVRKGNQHQRLLQERSQALLRHRQAMLNRKMAMERRRMYYQQRMIRQQQIRQRMIKQRGMHR
jgi:hypothetical protein